MPDTAPKTVTAPLAPKRFERLLGEFTTFMISQMFDRYANQAIGGLQVNTVEKFVDAKQVGNYSAVYLTLANRVKRKLLNQFNNKRLESQGRDFFQKVNADNQQRVYTPIAAGLGVDVKTLIAKEALKPDVNALISESVQWIKKLRDDTLEAFTASTLRGMSLGQSLEEIMGDFKVETSKRKNHAEFIARNQVSSFNAMTSKIRHQKLGIIEGIWKDSGDVRVRKCHKARNNKTFNLSEGLFSSCDGKTLFPGTDYQCRCTYKAIIPEFEDDE